MLKQDFNVRFVLHLPEVLCHVSGDAGVSRTRRKGTEPIQCRCLCVDQMFDVTA